MILLNGLTVTGGVNFTIQDGDPYWNNVSLLLPLTGTNDSTTFTDASTNNISVSGSGNAKISTTQSKWGNGSLYVNGDSGTYITSVSNSALQMGTGDFTMEGWYYFNSLAGNILMFYPETTGRLGIYFDGTALKFNVYSDPLVGLIAYPSTGVWYHIALTRSSGVIYAFLNGVLSNSWTNAYIQGTIGPGVLNAGLGSADCYVNDIRITKGVARYTSNFTPPTQPFPTF